MIAHKFGRSFKGVANSYFLFLAEVVILDVIEGKEIELDHFSVHVSCFKMID